MSACWTVNKTHKTNHKYQNFSSGIVSYEQELKKKNLSFSKDFTELSREK